MTSASRRDALARRTRRLTGWTSATALAGVALFAGLASVHTSTSHTGSATSTKTSSKTSTAQKSPTKTTTTTLGSAATTPTTTSLPAQTSSGGT